MTWRDPKPRDELTEVTCETLHELAAAYSPIVRFDDGERTFPILAESWLTHTTAAPWDAVHAEEDDLPVDPFRRGTAVCRATVDMAGLQLLAGTPNPADRPLQFSSDPGDLDAIGRFGGVDAGTFLDVGGWLPDSGLGAGDADYLYRLCSELSAVMNPAMAWQLVEGDPHVPHTWVPQPPNPTVYAEAEWAGMFPRWSTAGDLGDFPPEGDSTQLDGFLCLTYHYLYPMREPPPHGGSSRRLEGQWEAVSLFFAGDPGGRDASGRPRSMVFREPPEFVVISKGLERAETAALRQHPNEVRRWGQVERHHAHPVIYLTAGTHRHSFDPIAGSRWDPAANPPPGTGPTTSVPGEFPGMESLLLWAAAAGLAAGAALAAGAVVAAIVLLVVALLLLLAWLISLIWDAVNQASGDPLPPHQDNDEAGGGGVQGGGSDEPPAGGSSGPDPSSTQPPGTPNAGSPTGRDTVSFDVRLVDLFHHADERTGFPPKSACEHPHWWSYSGAWGVNVRPAVDSAWESGTRRVDEHQRSWGYWNALRLATFLNGGSAGP